MECITLRLSFYGNYSDREASNIEMEILSNFLGSDVRTSNATSYKEWALNPSQKAAGGNVTLLDKENNIIILTDMYSEEEKPTELRMTIQQFVQLLDDWQEKVCKHTPKEVTIKYENNEFTIETE